MTSEGDELLILARKQMQENGYVHGQVANDLSFRINTNPYETPKFHWTTEDSSEEERQAAYKYNTELLAKIKSRAFDDVPCFVKDFYGSRLIVLKVPSEWGLLSKAPV